METPVAAAHADGSIAECGPLMSLSEMLAAAERSTEATVTAIRNGLRYVLIIGAAAPPDKRDQFTTDLFEGIMTRFRRWYRYMHRSRLCQSGRQRSRRQS